MDWVIIILIVLAFALAFGIGSNDETMANVVGSGSLKLKRAVILGGVLAFLGVILLSGNVGKTIGKSLLGDSVNYNSFMMIAILLSTSIWLIISSKSSVPISTTHSVVGSIFGISFVWAISTRENYFLSINWVKISEVVLGWIISPILGFFGAIAMQLIIKRFMKYRSAGLLEVESTEKYLQYVILTFVCINQISRGGNDSANALGVLIGLMGSEDLTQEVVTILTFIIGLMLMAGLIFVGKNVIKNISTTTGIMRPSDSLSAEVSTSMIMLGATILGLPVSGSHILVFALIGSARMKGEKPDRKSFRRMVLSWFLTFPVAAILSAVIYSVLLLFV